MIIYHSREALTARVASLLHTGRLAPQADPAWAWEAVCASEAYGDEGLWPAGTDERGESVWAVGRASRPEVAQRVFHGLAELFAISPDRYLLVDVGPVHAWGDLLLVGLRRLGWGGLARNLEVRLIARRRGECLSAVERARAGLAARPQPVP